jgi:hypothetical protein
MHIKFVKNHCLWKNLRNLNTHWAEVHQKMSPVPSADRSFADIPANNTVCRKILVKNHSLDMFPTTLYHRGY